MAEVCHAIAVASGKSLQSVVDGEAQAILGNCVSYTKAAKVEKIHQRFEKREWTMQSPSGPYKKYRIKGKGHSARDVRQKKMPPLHGNRYPDAVWQYIMANRKESLEQKLYARGISKQAWYKLGLLLGIIVKAPNYVKRLKFNFDSNFKAERHSAEGNYAVSFMTVQPTLLNNGGAKVLQRAINSRITYFKKNVEEGVMADMEKLSRAYHEIFRTDGTHYQSPHMGEGMTLD